MSTDNPVQNTKSSAQLEEILTTFQLNAVEKLAVVGIVMEGVSQKEELGKKVLQVCKNMADTEQDKDIKKAYNDLYEDYYPVEDVEAEEADDDGYGETESVWGNIKGISVKSTALVEKFIEGVHNHQPIEETAIALGLLDKPVGLTMNS